MIPRVVVDANVPIAARLSGDQDHDRGATIARAFDHGDLPTAYVLGDVLEEVINYTVGCTYVTRRPQ